MTTTKPTHGGKRPGSGRKPINGVATVCSSVSLTPDVREYLRSCEGGISREIERMVRQSRGFREWAATRAAAES